MDEAEKVTLDTVVLGKTLRERAKLHLGAYDCASVAKDGDPTARWYVFGAGHFNVLGILPCEEDAREYARVMNTAKDENDLQ